MKLFMISLLLFLANDGHSVMGNILKLLTREEQEASESQIDIFLDFESKL